jgi:hypothetical protein
MIYLITIKLWRWFVFGVLVVGLLYAGMANAADFDQIELPYRAYVHAALGFLIVLHFGLFVYHGPEAAHVFMRMYLDNHYTVVEKGREPQSYNSDQWRQRQHEYDDNYDVKIYYNNPSGKESVSKRIR